MEREDRPTLARDLRLLALLGLFVLVLLILLADERSGLSETHRRIGLISERLAAARATIQQDRDLLLPPLTRVHDPHLLSRKSMLTLIKEATEKVGIAEKLAVVNPGRDRKRGLLKAQVTLFGVTIREYVDFMLYLKNLSAGIEDGEAAMRMIGYNEDSWRISLTLTAPPGKPPPPGKERGRAPAEE